MCFMRRMAVNFDLQSSLAVADKMAHIRRFTKVEYKTIKL